jgi:simple sugar transport system ATP-binding protein
MNNIVSLKMENITKRFPGILVLNQVNIEVHKGEVLALVGENGAGKTTLMNILMGLYQCDEGFIEINGEKTIFSSPSDAFANGMGMVHQNYMLVPNLTVTENIALGFKEVQKGLRLDLKIVKEKIDGVSKKYGLHVDPDAYIWQLSVGEQQRVELVKTLCLGAKCLILDEPTSALTPQEIDELIELLLIMKEELPIIFISHKLQEVKDLSDRVSILRHGQIVFDGLTKDHSPSDIASLMTGHEIVMAVNNEEDQGGEDVLCLKGVNAKGDRNFLTLNDLDLTVRAGEIVGLAGVSGNGQKELAQVINGLRKIEDGSITFYGETIANKSPNYIIKKGMGYIPEDRNSEGIVPPFSMKENLILKDCDSDKFSKHKVIDYKKVDSNADLLKEQFDIRCASTSTSAGSYSGGNIQKVILARELSRKPKFLIAVYPTRGLDLGAVEFIHDTLLKKRNEGLGILLISEELDEILRLSDRIAVIFKGHIQKVLPKKEADKQSLGILMAGVKDDQ